MAERGGQPGNTNAKRSRLFEQAFIRELKQRDLEAGDGETLRKVVAKIIDMAIAGDVQAFREARDTVDGKPNLAIELSGEVGSYVARTPNVSPNADAWAKNHAPAAACDSQPSKE